MINFNKLEDQKEELKFHYLSNQPFPHLVINNFCNEISLEKMVANMPELSQKSRDSIFAKNKFEKSRYYEISQEFEEFHKDIMSERFATFLSYITGKEIFIDPENHGGGLHQGKGKSKLDMHLDYNYHPIEKSWWRELNILFYFSPGWKSEYGGQLKLEDLRTGKTKELDIPYNTLIIQQCSSYSLHGYEETNFPEGKARLSIASYAFQKHSNIIETPRTTDWFPDRQGGGSLKQFLGRNIHKAIKLKSKILGSGTAKNK